MVTHILLPSADSAFTVQIRQINTGLICFISSLKFWLPSVVHQIVNERTHEDL